MKNQVSHLLIALALLATLNLQPSTALAQGTAFTYQGQLLTTNGSAHGLYDFTFALYNASSGGSQAGSTIQTNGVFVTNGLFMATMDFGAGIFNGTAYWLQIGVRTNAAASFTALTSRQELTPAPYAIYAENAAMLAYGTALGTGLGNSILGGGTYDFIGGGQFNTNGAPNSTISGGAANYIESGANISTIGGGANNTIQPSATDSTIGGGTVNSIQTGAYQSTIAGGNLNVIQSGANQATIAGGDQNVIQASAVDSTIGGGTYNTNSNSYATVGGGSHNTASGEWSFVGGGYFNVASGNYATVAGGDPNTASGTYSAIGGGNNNTASGQYSFIGGGNGNINASINSTISGGTGNTIQLGGLDCSIAGGGGNTIDTNNSASAISGGSANMIAGNVANGFIGGGYQNTNAGTMSVIGGGQLNYILLGSPAATISGGSGNTIDSSCDYSTIAGGSTNTIWYIAFDSVIGGGQNNEIINSSDHCTIAGGWGNGIASLNSSSTIGGGYENGIGGGQYGDNPIAATIPGGANNYAGGDYSFAAGEYARANDNDSFVWSDGSATVSSFGANTFTAHASGGFQFQLASSTVAISASGTLSVPVLTITGGSDVAEPFTMSSATIPKGSVVIIDEAHPGQLKISDQPYDTRVAGIVSGANGVNPGISLHQVNVLNGDQNVALSGRVYVLADTSNGSIHPGDLLTTSVTPGHAMKVTDHVRAQGAILGKAMTGLSEGKGMVLVLVTLQ